MITIYTYRNCATCRKATAWLRANEIAFEEKPIRETPPSKPELRQVLQSCGGEIRRLFNTSGQDYRKLNLKDRLPEMTEEEALDLLSENGNLVKRPFVLTENGGFVGFKEEEWKTVLMP